jgi:hypothetical protein
MIPDPNCFRVLAGPYAESEKWMLENVIADLKRGGIDFRIVGIGNQQVEIWRSTQGWLAIEEVGEP